MVSHDGGGAVGGGSTARDNRERQKQLLVVYKPQKTRKLSPAKVMNGVVLQLVLALAMDQILKKKKVELRVNMKII